ncbi:hypothetical protein FACS189429_7200 [Bacteroidia bacterium]|nr:hypothetical protein FACS189429_7200 [Bacteroidia bacterium]
MKKNNLLIISLLLISTLLVGQTVSDKMSPATRIFLQEKTNFADSANKNLQKSRFMLKSVDNVEYASCLIKLHDTENLDDLRALGVHINTVLSSIITAKVPVNQLEAVAALPNVERLEIATKAYKTMDKARLSANADKAQSGYGLLNDTPFTGKNVVVGILDGGFEYGHINFYDSTGVDLRVRRVWNQNASYAGNPPSGYDYGTELATADAILAAHHDTPNDTHATHVTGIAAGAYRGLNYWGVAPEADIVMVSYNMWDSSADNVSLIDGINYIYNYAAEVNKPAVANMSLGYHGGPHDGTSLFDIACDDLQGAGRLLVGAAGNEGGDKIHISKTFSAAADTLKTFVIRPSGYTMDYTDLNVWGEPNKNMWVQVVIFNRAQRKILFATDFVNASQTNDLQFTLNANDTTGASGTFWLSTEKYSENGKPSAYVQTNYNFNVKTGNLLGIRVISENGTTVHAWTSDQISEFSYSTFAAYGWQNGDSDYTVGEIGGTGDKIISVGAYTSRNRITTLYTYNNEPTGESLNDIASFSSKGPRSDGHIKPDIAAPGTMLISSFNKSAVTSSNSEERALITNKQMIAGYDYYFGLLQGTSMAAPLVTGVLAQWLQANPQLTPEDVRQIFSQTAKVDAFTGAVPNNRWGYGKIDAWAGLLNILELTPTSEIAAGSQQIAVKNPIENIAELVFKYNDNDVNLYFMDMNGRLIFSKNISQITENELITLTETANLPTGNYIFYYKGKEKSGAMRVIKK